MTSNAFSPESIIRASNASISSALYASMPRYLIWLICKDEVDVLLKLLYPFVNFAKRSR